MPLRILIADDEPIARLDLREMLEALGHEVVAEAADGESALKFARAFRPSIAILDIRMPGLDGLEVAQTLAEERIAPTLILSAYTDQEYLDRSRDSGCLCYLVKPFRQGDLGPAIAMTLSLSDRLNGLRAEIDGLQESMLTRKAVERAKGILMDKFNLKEHDAFRRIQAESMNSHRTVREVAESIIDVESVIAGEF